MWGVPDSGQYRAGAGLCGQVPSIVAAGTGVDHIVSGLEQGQV